jgi:hypothetical protein
MGFIPNESKYIPYQSNHEQILWKKIKITEALKL